MAPAPRFEPPRMLCAGCTVALYHCGKYPVSLWDVDYSQPWGERIADPNRALALAEEGATFQSASKTVFRPLAVTQVNGTFFCGTCAAEALEKKGFYR